VDLNYLLYRQQVSLMRSRVAASVEARHAHAGLARGYGHRVHALQASLGAAVATRRPAA
jgi:hypothetical protein